MPQPRTPTGLNHLCASQLRRKILAELRNTVISALRPMHALTTAETITPAQAVAALAKLRGARRDLNRLAYELAGVQVLSGAGVKQLSGATGIPRGSLSRHLPATPAVWRGREITTDPCTPWGWRPI